jgi:hypothetical protein
MIAPPHGATSNHSLYHGAHREATTGEAGTRGATIGGVAADKEDVPAPDTFCAHHCHSASSKSVEVGGSRS